MDKSAGGNERTAVLIVAAVLAAAALTLGWRASGPRPAPTADTSPRSEQEPKITARQLVIEKVEQLWIRDALRRSLQQAVQLEIGLDRQPGALADPFGDDWRTGRLQPLGASEPLPPGTSLLTVLGQARHRRCLVIGAPGSGKTTHLLQLAEDLIGEAKTRAEAPVPVVLLLSRWTAAYPDLQSWVSAEVGERYDVARSDVDHWLDSGSVILLLDGLDEIGSQRTDCLRALNAFAHDPAYSSVGLVLTCRTRDYETLPERLRFDIAVGVRPLGQDQVARALLLAGPDLDALRHAVSADATLAGLLTTPLMLGVTVLAYRGAPASTPVPTGGPERLRALIYAEFVQRMLKRNRSLRPFEATPARSLPFGTEATYDYLIWLAKMMRRRHQTVFYPDWLTPEWLPNRRTRWPLRHRRGLAGWLARRLGWDHTSTCLVGARLAALIGALAVAPLGALAGGLPGALLAAAGCGAIFGLGVGVTFGVLLQIPAVNRLFVPFIGSAAENPYAASAWTWSWHRALRGLMVWLIAGLVVIGVPLGELTGWSTGIAAALVLGSGGALGGGTVPDLTEPPASPGRALQASTLQLARLLAIMTAATVLATVLAFAVKGPWTAVIASLPITVALMLTAGPGRAWLRSRAVSFGIHRAGLLPRNLIAFLHHGDERIILQRTFGGFAFIHRTLRDYLADQTPDATRPGPW